VYIPPENTVNFLAFMKNVLKEERQKAKAELQKTLANLYPSAALPVITPPLHGPGAWR